MLEFNLPDQNYVLSLDNLDISLLSQFIEKPPDEKRLLWSKSYLNGDSTWQKCEVKILREEIQDDSYTEPSETYMCHICNIDVPQIYFKQHIESRKHYRYKTLTEKVVEMAASKINIDIDSLNSDYNSDNFYCDTCCKVVLKIHKEEHNKSKFHLKSLEYQKVADKFLQIFVDKKAIETVFKDYEIESDDMQEKNNGKSNFEDLLNTDEDIDNFSDSDSDTEKYEDIPFNDNVYDYPESPKISDSSDTENEKSNIALDKLLHRAPVIFDENNTYQQYLKKMISKYKLQCKMPIVKDNLVMIETPKGFTEMVTMDSFHGYKYINRKYMFCQLCKVWINKSTNHIISEDHVKNILQPVNDSFLRQLIEDSRVNHCLLCNELVTTPDHVTFHHKKNQWKSTQREEIPSDTFCYVCNVQTFDLLGHNNSIKHEKKKKAINDKAQKVLNKINSELKNLNLNQYTYNRGTDIFSPSTSKAKAVKLNDNVKTYTNEEKLHEYKKQLIEVSATEMKCLICDDNFAIHNSNNIITHFQTIKHKISLDSLLHKHKIVQQSFNQYYCEFCQCHINDFINHIDENLDHIIKFLLNNTINKKELREYVYTNPLKDDPLACAYRQIHKELLQRNRIERSNASLFYCNVCSINLTVVSDIDHMFGKRHKNLLKSKGIAVD